MFDFFNNKEKKKNKPKEEYSIDVKNIPEIRKKFKKENIHIYLMSGYVEGIDKISDRITQVDKCVYSSLFFNEYDMNKIEDIVLVIYIAVNTNIKLFEFKKNKIHIYKSDIEKLNTKVNRIKKVEFDTCIIKYKENINKDQIKIITKAGDEVKYNDMIKKKITYIEGEYIKDDYRSIVDDNINSIVKIINICYNTDVNLYQFNNEKDYKYNKMYDNTLVAFSINNVKYIEIEGEQV